MNVASLDPVARVARALGLAWLALPLVVGAAVALQLCARLLNRYAKSGETAAS